MADMPFVVQMSVIFFGIAISFLLLVFSPTIAHAIRKDIAKNTHKSWSDEKLDARQSYLLFNNNIIRDAELDAIREIQEARMDRRMSQYGKDKWKEWKDKV
jgi:hypothetical protein